MQMTPENQNEPILTHVHFKAPLDIDISDIEAGWENETPLFMNLKPLLEASGLRRSFWGRVAEEPEEVIICAVWWTRKAVSDFESSPAYTKFCNDLAAGGNHPTTVYIDGAKHMIEAMLEGKVSITTVDFPTPVTAEQKAQFYSIQGLTYSYGISRSLIHTRATRCGNCKGWVDTTHIEEGREYERCVIWHFWDDEEEKERSFRAEEKVYPNMVSQKDEIFPMVLEGKLRVEEKFEMDLKKAGAESWKEIHCDFVCLPS
ncbi:MAG: hypothetical protein Q9221_008601 [Calogaya cf. arnoldii]